MFNYLRGLLERWTKNKDKKKIVNKIEESFKKKHLSRWEKNFLASIENRDLLTLSKKQLHKLDEIYYSSDVPRLRGRNSHLAIYDDSWSDEKSDPRFCDKHGVSYDDVHDFDK